MSTVLPRAALEEAADDREQPSSQADPVATVHKRQVKKRRRRNPSDPSEEEQRSSQNGTQVKPSTEVSRADSLGGALTRALVGTLAFVFRAPVRLFRPVKLSSWSLLEAMAKRDGKSLSLRYMRQIIKREKASFLPHLLIPPLLANTAVGFALFEAYTLTEQSLLDRRLKKISERADRPAKRPEFTPLHIVFSSGFVAGAAQCVVSAPLDNVRLVLSSRRKQHGLDAHRPHLIRWRDVARAAVLPFAPATTHERLVNRVKGMGSSANGTSRGNSSQVWSAENRKELEKTLRRWRGGVHGAGLILSLARDSVGFAAFFTVFEVSRRLAHRISRSIDRSIACFNASSALPSSAGVEVASTGDTRTPSNHASQDVSYSGSRTKTGRIVAAFILIVGGAVGAALYELVGRPAELMRLVVWEGRKAWEEGRRSRKKGSGTTHRGASNLSKRRTGAQLGGRSKIVGGRRLANRLQEEVSRVTRTGGRLSSYLDLRRRNSAGVSASRVFASRLLSRPARVKGRRTKNASLTNQVSDGNIWRPKAPMVADHSHGRRRPASSMPKNLNRLAIKPRPARPLHQAPPPLSTRPTAMSLLVEHAERTSILKYTSSHRSSTTPVPVPILLLHTYFIAPFLALSSPSTTGSAPLQSRLGTDTLSKRTSASRRAPVGTSRERAPERAVRERWTLKNPVVAAPGSLKSAVTARSWGSGRVAWALRRLATPYGIGFLAWAYVSGDI
ncbi:hypothetical protein CBOM_02902 [Ceraceosorus bombacis]|uniref:Mitochondrial carrier protein n=1 Tax=Ceraceosorus bombacis TaxID=401625 RepID=A0A0P1BGJ7_9BASI|nr:hypothetical protein CBOM_02902 [Ceraceosorus bombacis]